MSRFPFMDLDTLGVVATNSTGFLRAMLAALEEGRVTVPLRAADDAERLVRTSTKDVIIPEEGQGWLGLSTLSKAGADPAMISFTSGTEGASKAVLLARDSLHDAVMRLTNTMEITSEIREYIGVPVTHSFGYGRARVVAHAGGDGYLPEAGFDLMEIRRMLRAGQINAISTVPSLWRLFLKQRDLFGSELEAVRWVEIGSQFMSADEKQALREALPKAIIVQHYGLTEASRSALQRIDTEPYNQLGSVGQAYGKVELRIGPGERIMIRGPHVALGVDDGTGYHALGPGAWLTTNDRGRLEDGRLWFEGRADDMINCGGIKLSPDLMEAYVRQKLPEVGDFGLLRRDDYLRGEGVLLALTPATAAQAEDIAEAVITYAEERGAALRGGLQTRELPDLPRTATGKLQRKALAEQLAEIRENPLSEGGIQALLQDIFGDVVDQTASFLDLGGDSLAHMQLALTLERALGEPPADWESQPLGELAAQIEAAGDLAALAGGPTGAPPLPKGDCNMNPGGLSFWELVVEDFRTNDASVFHQGFLMLFVHRFGNWRMDVRPKLLRAPLTLLYRFLNKLAQLFFGMKLDYTVKVGRRVKLEHFGGMILGAREIGDDVILRQNTTLGIRSTDDLNAKPTIGPRTDVGAGAVIVGNITVGENSIIGANSVVFTNVPPGAVVMGVPGRVIGRNPRENPSPLCLGKR
ncbi:MAG: AMP-binding protein [Parvularcula sp.]|jgi:serine acetyltransferase/acyl-CoA synthetase (AMP-forming)/AMP-acid ligase II|nr:AMP-binding protein [Parvularcula sp.]